MKTSKLKTSKSRSDEFPAVWLRASTCILAALIAILTGVNSQDAFAQTSVFSDPSGDADFSAPGFQDLIRTEVSKEGDEFVVRFEVAAPVPANPPLPRPAMVEIWWLCAFNLDLTTDPAGYPNAPGGTLPGEVITHIGWNGTSFTAEAIDRRPLLTGGEAIITTVPFNILGSTLELHVPSALLGNPTSFRVGIATSDWSGPGGTGGFHFVDLIEGIKNWP